MKLQIEEYEVNSCTMFLEPVNYGSKIYSQIFELEDEYISPFTPLELIKKSCNYFGVDYESRKKGTRHLIGYNRKIPIAIEPANRIYFFPTSSPTRSECIWIAHEHVENYRRIGPNQTLVIFRNKQSRIFQVPFSTIEGQMLRTALLKTKLMQRIEGNKRLIYPNQDRKPVTASESPHGYE